MSKDNTRQVREAQATIANGKSSREDRDEAFRTIGRIDRAERKR